MDKKPSKLKIILSCFFALCIVLSVGLFVAFAILNKNGKFPADVWCLGIALFLLPMGVGAFAFPFSDLAKVFFKDFLFKKRRKNIEKNIFIIHSLNGDTLKFWGQDIKQKFEEKFDVFMPKFPIREESKYEKFDKILSKYLKSNELNKNSIVICHSIGNPYFIRFCREHNFVPTNYIAVAPGAVYEYPSTRNDYTIEVKKQSYLKKQDFEFAKNFEKIYMLYSDEDDKNPEKFTRFSKDFNTKDYYLKGYNHFDGYHRIYQIPELVELIKKLTK